MSQSPFGPGDTVGPAPVPAEHAALAKRLRTAEDRLFPLAMVDAERYQHAVTLVGLLARRLSETCPTLDTLAGAEDQLRAWLAVHARDEGIPLQTLDPELVIDAAMAQRFRGLLAEQAGELQRQTLERARVAGQAWAVLEEPDAAAWTGGAARWVEVHTGTEALMVRSATADPRTGEATYVLEVTSDGVRSEEFTDRDAWLAAVEAVRADFASES